MLRSLACGAVIAPRHCFCFVNFGGVVASVKENDQRVVWLPGKPAGSAARCTVTSFWPVPRCVTICQVTRGAKTVRAAPRQVGQRQSHAAARHYLRGKSRYGTGGAAPRYSARLWARSKLLGPPPSLSVPWQSSSSNVGGLANIGLTTRCSGLASLAAELGIVRRQGAQLPESQALRSRSAALTDHVFGSGNPSNELINHGRFPRNWVHTYLGLVHRASDAYRDAHEWPREIVSAIHFASFYLEVRYEAWARMSGTRNPSTERQLREVRTPSELFLLAGTAEVTVAAPGSEGSPSSPEV